MLHQPLIMGLGWVDILAICLSSLFVLVFLVFIVKYVRQKLVERRKREAADLTLFQRQMQVQGRKKEQDDYDIDGAYVETMRTLQLEAAHAEAMERGVANSGEAHEHGKDPDPYDSDEQNRIELGITPRTHEELKGLREKMQALIAHGQELEKNRSVSSSGASSRNASRPDIRSMKTSASFTSTGASVRSRSSDGSRRRRRRKEDGTGSTRSKSGKPRRRRDGSERRRDGSVRRKDGSVRRKDGSHRRREDSERRKDGSMRGRDRSEQDSDGSVRRRKRRDGSERPRKRRSDSERSSSERRRRSGRSSSGRKRDSSRSGSRKRSGSRTRRRKRRSDTAERRSRTPQAGEIGRASRERQRDEEKRTKKQGKYGEDPPSYFDEEEYESATPSTSYAHVTASAPATPQWPYKSKDMQPHSAMHIPALSDSDTNSEGIHVHKPRGSLAELLSTAKRQGQGFQRHDDREISVADSHASVRSQDPFMSSVRRVDRKNTEKRGDSMRRSKSKPRSSVSSAASHHRRNGSDVSTSSRTSRGSTQPHSARRAVSPRISSNSKSPHSHAKSPALAPSQSGMSMGIQSEIVEPTSPIAKKYGAKKSAHRVPRSGSGDVPSEGEFGPSGLSDLAAMMAQAKANSASMQRLDSNKSQQPSHNAFDSDSDSDSPPPPPPPEHGSSQNLIDIHEEDSVLDSSASNLNLNAFHDAFGKI